MGALSALSLAVRAMTGMVGDLEPDEARMKSAAGEGYATATDLADWLVRTVKMPFRDAHHITAPAEDGSGAFRAMRNALKRSGLAADSIDYVNAHGTSTPLGDEIELKAVERLVGNAAGRISMSSTKSSIGHLLGAAGAVEFIIGALAVRDCIVPPTINLNTPDPELDLNFTPNTAVHRPVRTVLSNSFGFGGHNVTLAIKRFEE